MNDLKRSDAAQVSELQQRVRELERAVGTKTLENEILNEALEIERKRNSFPRTAVRR